MPTKPFETRRAAAVSIGLQFTDFTAHLRSSIEDRYIEVSMLSADPQRKGIEIYDVQKAVSDIIGNGTFLTNLEHLQDCIDKLVTAKRIMETAPFSTSSSKIKSIKYSLTERAHNELSAESFHAEAFWNYMLGALCRGGVTLDQRLQQILWYCMLDLISLSAGEISRMVATARDQISLYDLLKKIVSNYSNINGADGVKLVSALAEFVSSEDSAVTQIKWILAQNFFFLRLMGYTNEGMLLRESILGGSIFYLDANVIVSACINGSPEQSKVISLIHAAKEMNIELRVCEITLKEVAQFYDYAIKKISRYEELIPDQILYRVKDEILHAYRNARVDNPKLSAQEFLRPILDVKSKFLQSNSIAQIHELWFVTANTSSDTEHMELQIAQKEKREKEAGKSFKSEASLRHDALLCRWVSLEKQRIGQSAEVFLITRDNVLPGLFKVGIPENDGEPRIPILHLDAALQWLGPFTAPGTRLNAARVYMKNFVEQVFPKQPIWYAEEFQIFEMIDASTRDMSIEEIDGVLMFVREAVKKYDLKNKTDHELFIANVQRYYTRKVAKLIKPIRDYESIIQSKYEEKELQLTQEYEYAMSTLQHQIQDELINNEALIQLLIGNRKSVVLLVSSIAFVGLIILVYSLGAGVNPVQQWESVSSIEYIILSLYVLHICLIVGPGWLRKNPYLALFTRDIDEALRNMNQKDKKKIVKPQYQKQKKK